MKKIKYIFRCIKNLDYKNMYKIAIKIAKKQHKLTLVILIDMIICGFVYGAGYYDYQEFEFYLLNKKERKTYLTRAKNNMIISKYNNKNDFYLLDDKVLFNKNFKKYIKRDCLKIDNYEEFDKFTDKHKSFIAKPIDGCGGKGIAIYDICKSKKKLFNKLIESNQLLIEELIVQHKDINELYDGSVNSLRLFTFNNGKEVNVINSIFKIGNGGCIDNFSSGSMYTFVDDNGRVIVPAIDQNDNFYEKHPISNKKIVGFNVPFYKEACRLVEEASKEVPSIKYIGWDVAISDRGPVIIEGNSYPGVFQVKPSLSKNKIGLIPKYSKYMDIK